MRENIFLLGGYDLEMVEIRKILEQKSIIYKDKQLGWSNAKLEEYLDVLQEYGNNPIYKIIGIELHEEGVTTIPSNYIRIDHHNDYSHKLSAIEQVCELLDIPLTRHLQLVAANDKGYIPAMKDLGATSKEIEEIRRLDRASQGVTEEDEQLAEKSIENCKESSGDVVVVKALTNKFSCICDKLYYTKHLLIYNSKELNYYGEGKSKVLDYLQKECGKENVYSGGGNNGYVGLINTSENTIFNIKGKIFEMLKTLSYHIFYYPFKWEVADGGKSSNGFPSIKNNNLWEQVTIPDEFVEKKEVYDEKNYFFPFVHSALYDRGNEDENNLIKHFKRKGLNKDTTYNIELKSKTYQLKVDAININLYSTGAGVLIFYLENNRSDQFSTHDILKINQFGRRIFPPFYNDIEERLEIANKLSITKLNESSGAKNDEVETRYEETFGSYTDAASWKEAKFITSLIEDLNPKLKTKAIVDDRMFVNCWYANNDLSREIAEDESEVLGSKSGLDNFLYKDDFWYKYIFVDGDGKTCQNSAMQQKLVDSSTYFRWQGYGSLIGVTRYSLVMLANERELSCNILAKHMRTIYSRMFELTIIQRVSILIFSERIKDITISLEANRHKIEQTTILYQDYIKFINQIHFREITAQDQGIDIYNMISQKMQIEKYVKELDTEIDELNNYVHLLDDKVRNKKTAVLSVLASIFLVPTLAMNILSTFKECDTIVEYKFIIVVGAICLGIGLPFLLPRLWDLPASFVKNKNK